MLLVLRSRRRLDKNRNLLHGSQRRHDVNRVGIPGNRHSGHFDGIAIVDVIVLTLLHWWRRRRRRNAKWMIGIGGRRRNSTTVVVNNSSPLPTALHAASMKTGAASTDDKEDNDEEDDGHDHGNDAGNRIQNTVKFIKETVAPNVGSTAGLKIAANAIVTLLTNANVHDV